MKLKLNTDEDKDLVTLSWEYQGQIGKIVLNRTQWSLLLAKGEVELEVKEPTYER